MIDTAAVAPEPPRPPLSQSTQLGIGILAAAVSLGVLGDGLLRALPWGLNVPVFAVALTVAGVALARWRGLALVGEGRWLVVPALFCALSVAWRDSLTLKVSNILALLVFLALVGFRTRAGRVVVADFLDYALALFDALLHAAGGVLVLLIGDIRWQEVPRSGWTRQALAVGRGLAIALPLLLVFGALFVAADAVFAGLVSWLFGWDLAEILSHLFLAGIFAWIVAGFLRQLLIGHSWPGPQGRADGRPLLALGRVELGIVLGLLNGLFLAFVVVQFRYLFGGAALVDASVTLTYAEYARRGFFELVAVAALVLPLLLVADWLAGGHPAARRLCRALSATLILLLFVVMFSALQRMRLYTVEFGLTELRIYTTTFMGWLAVVFVWFVATVLPGRRERFAFGALVAAFLALVALNAINPDALIVRTNVGRTHAAQPLDARYVASLSADAVPTLVELLPAMTDQQRQIVTARVLTRWAPPEQVDWRTWSWGRHRAWWAVAEYQEAAIETLSHPQRPADRPRLLRQSMCSRSQSSNRPVAASRLSVRVATLSSWRARSRRSPVNGRPFALRKTVAAMYPVRLLPSTYG